MSEKLLQHESLPKFEEHELITAHATPENKVEQDPALAASEARKAVEETTQAETQLNPLERLEAAEKAPQEAQHGFINTQLKQISLRRELQQIQRKLPARQKALSKVIHQPAIRRVSELSAKTVSRPSGLLGGGVLALVGTSGYLYLAKHIGFSYNYGVFLLLFAGGFALGITLEVLISLTFARRKIRD
jgi:hypothetical protein